MLVIFDLDGTLLDTIDDLAAAVNHALAACGFAARSVDECRTFVGNGVSKLLERALPVQARTTENRARMRAAFFSYYDEHLTDKTYPYAGITELLTNLQERGIKLAVCSNKYERATKHLITHFFPSIKFVAVLGQREGIPTKPHPHCVEEILSMAHEQKENCLYVGDSDVDMQTAQNAGIKACAVTWGFRSRDVLAVYKPFCFIGRPADFLLFPEIQHNNHRT